MVERLSGLGGSYHNERKRLAGSVLLLMGGTLAISVILLALPNLQPAVVLCVLLPGTLIGSVLMGLGGVWMRKSGTTTLLEVPRDLVPAARELIAKHRKTSRPGT